MRVLVSVLLLAACGNTVAPEFHGGGSRSERGQFGLASPSQGAEAGDSGTTDPCGEDGACELTVSSVAVSGGEVDTGHAVSAIATGGGNVAVLESSVAYGCCPDVAVTAELDASSGRIVPTATFGSDVCACFLVLDLSYTVGGVPAGTWTVDVGDASTTVTVP